jgi:lysozyme
MRRADSGGSRQQAGYMSNSNVVIDLSHHNGRVNLAAAKNAGVLGVIHKATQGWAYADPLYQSNREAALSAGLLWGAYAYGVGADGVAQAEFFLSTVFSPTGQPDRNTLLVLDFEANRADSSMDLTEARAFVTHVQQKTGRWPGLYGGHYLKELLGKSPDPVLSNCWLWLAQYGPTAVLPPGWSAWTMWQYTDGAAGPEPHEVPGFGHCDRDLFSGTPDELRNSLWLGGLSAAPAVAPVNVQAPYAARVTTGLLNVRNGPRQWANIADQLTLGTSVCVYEERDGWCRIDSADALWVSGRFLSKVYSAVP